MLRNVFFCAVAVALIAGCKPAEAPVPQPSAMAGAPAVATTVPTAPPPAPVPTSNAAPAGAAFIAMGTEPFWSVKVAGGKATYTTPEDQVGQPFAVVAAQNGTRWQFNGTLAGQPFALKLRLETCSDGMSDRSYRYAADLAVRGEQRKGCAEPGSEFKGE